MVVFLNGFHQLMGCLKEIIAQLKFNCTKNKMFSFGGSYENKNTFLSLDIGLSNTDENLFSKN